MLLFHSLLYHYKYYVPIELNKLLITVNISYIIKAVIKMQRYFAISEDLKMGDSDIHHIINVMRMKVNDEFEIIYNKKCYICKIDKITDSKLLFSVIREITNNNELDTDITIGMALVKDHKFDLILQKVTELGVSKIIPLKTNRSIIKLTNEKKDKKLDRWFKICKEASEQSSRLIIPIIENITDINKLDSSDYDLKIVCSVNEKSTNIKEVLQKKQNYDKILVIIGPEGGLTDKEEEKLINDGYIRVSLGSRILRTETAPIFVLSVINYELMR
jgi:16S rRNA (uracil1498-N3)-methyltransferase